MRHRVHLRQGVRFDRTGLLLVVFFVLGVVVVAKLFYVQIVRNGYYEAIAEGQYGITKEILQSRGEVYMYDFRGHELEPLIVNKKAYLLFGVPKEIADPAVAAKKMADILDDNEKACQGLLAEAAADELIAKCEQRKQTEMEFVLKLEKNNDPYEPLRHYVSEEAADQIKALDLKGIYFDDEWIRFYPEGETAGQVSGFLGFGERERLGQYGVEGYFETELAGKSGEISGNKDVHGRLIPVAKSELVEPKNGMDIILTIDKVIQKKTFEILKDAVETSGAKDGTVTVMDAKSGKILAMVGYPSFDPNNYAEVESIDVYKNKSVEPYEPGSVFKLITMAVGLDSGAVTPSDTHDDEGFVQIGEHTIKNANNQKYGTVTMTEILEKSINSGAVHVALLTGRETFGEYINKFGFGEKTEIGLSGEEPGDVSSLDKPGDIYVATASFGQGITVTPIQMLQAIGTITHGGKMLRPKLIDYVQDERGNRYNFGGENTDAQVIKPETAAIIKAMMVSVIKNGGHSNQANVAGYYMGGKTGTAEVARDGKYTNETIHSFIGFGPLEETRFVIMVKLTNPTRYRFAESTAAPAFAKVANFLLQYYQIPPEISIE